MTRPPREQFAGDHGAATRDSVNGISRVATAANPESATDRVIALLKRVRRSGRGFTALCPAHDDSSASLSVTPGHDGRVLMKCHAGCDVVAILAALGLSSADLFADAPARGVGPIVPKAQGVEGRLKLVASYDYYDADGSLAFQVCRFEPKTFRQRRPAPNGEWTWGLGDVAPILYRLPELHEAVGQGKRVYIAEGEKDVDNLTAIGANATTSPMGAGRWRDSYSAALAGAAVVLLPDNDDPGRKHMDTVAASLAAAGAHVRILSLPNAPVKGDVSDWIAHGGTLDALEQLADAADEWTSSGLTRRARGSENGAEPKSTPRLARPLVELLADPELTREPVITIEKLLVENATTLIAAREKLGKTTLASQAIAAFVDGRSFLGATSSRRGDVLWYTIDEPTRDTVIRFARIITNAAAIYISDVPRTFAELLAHLGADLMARNYDIVVIDTVSRALQQSGIKTNDPDVVGAAIRALVDVFRSFGVAGLLIYHTNKLGSEYSGSVAIGATVDEIIVLKARGRGSDPDDEDDDHGDDDGRRWLICAGRRLRGRYALDYNEDGYRLSDEAIDSPDERILKLAAKACDTERPPTKSELATAAKGRKATALKRIDVLRVGGLLAISNGRYVITKKGRERIGGSGTDEIDRLI